MSLFCFILVYSNFCLVFTIMTTFICLKEDVPWVVGWMSKTKTVIFAPTLTVWHLTSGPICTLGNPINLGLCSQKAPIECANPSHRGLGDKIARQIKRTRWSYSFIYTRRRSRRLQVLFFPLVLIFAELKFEPRASLTGPCSHPEDVLTLRAGRAILGLHWTGHHLFSPSPHKCFLSRRRV